MPSSRMNKLGACSAILVPEIPCSGHRMELPIPGRADILKNKGGIVNLKTTSDLRNFVYSARHKYSYNVQVYIL